MPKKRRKIPLRTCVVTRERHPKGDMLRIVRNKEGDIFPDPSGKAHGRGAYIKKDRETLEKAKKNRALDRAFSVKVPDEVYERIEAHLDA